MVGDERIELRPEESIQLVLVEGVDILEVSLADERTIERVVLALVALDVGAISRFVLVAPRGDRRLVVVGSDDPAGTRGTVRRDGTTWQAELARTEVRYWVSTLVRVVHGGSPVDHIDVELDDRGAVADLIIRFPQTLPDLTPQQAADRLGE